MRAAVLQAYNEPMVIEEITLADLGPTSVRLHIDASGVCHSDVTAAQGKVPMGTPLILGHEGTGTVLAVGSDVSRVKVGDRIIASFVPACGDCFFCLDDQSQLCEGMGAASFGAKGTRPDGSEVRGMTGLGTFADEMQIDESMCVKIETDLPSDQLALIGCGVTTGVGAALNTAQIKPGSTVAVIGCGGVGQSVLQGARIAGASRIFAIDPVEMKRKTAEQLGATDLIDPADGDPVEQVQALTDGRGADYAFEVIGLPETIQQAYDDGPPAAAPRSSSACRRSTPRSRSRRWSSSTARSRSSAACTAAPGAPRLPAARRPGRDGPPRHRRDGVAADHARRGQRRLPGDGSRRGHPQRHRLSPGVTTAGGMGRGPRMLDPRGQGDQDRLPDGQRGARSCHSRLRTILVDPIRDEGGRDPYRTGLFGHSLLRAAPGPSR